MSADGAREIYCNGSFEWDAEDVKTFERMSSPRMNLIEKLILLNYN
jgi:hypothetical protein